VGSLNCELAVAGKVEQIEVRVEVRMLLGNATAFEAVLG
jgi:hypothetical protein